MCLCVDGHGGYFILTGVLRYLGLGLPLPAIPAIPLLSDGPLANGNIPISQPPGAAPLAGFSLSPSSEPFPQKLVDKVRSGQFIEMRDLMTDNISLLSRMEALGTQAIHPFLPGAMKPRLREVSSITSWLYCYLAYVAMRTSDPTTVQMLAYGRLLIREAQQHQGHGWMEYDRVFRQQAAIDQSKAWNILHADIQASTILGRNPFPYGGMYCTLCFETDHRADHCALQYFAQPTQQAVRPPNNRRPETMLRICYSWNRGNCSFPGRCTFRHVCATCFKNHMARDCPATSDSEYKSDRPLPPGLARPGRPNNVSKN